jgi:AMMECR1 domain-containing protein
MMNVNQKIAVLFLGVLPFCMEIIAYGDGMGYSGQDPMLAQWEEFSRRPDSRELLLWLRCHARAKLAGARCKDRLNVIMPAYFGRLGIFITLKKGKKVRGCYGAFSHASADIEKVFLEYLSGALTGDARYEPLDAAEVETADIIVSITSPAYAVADLDSVDLLRYGISVACGEEQARVYVPAELRNMEDLRNFIQGKECQISAFRAITVR